MEADERSLRATLGYYGALRRPLTLVELSERLIPSARLGHPGPRPDLGMLASRTDSLVRSGEIATEYGFFALTVTPGGFGRSYIRRQKETARKYQRILKFAWWMQALPYLRSLMTSGSLAMSNCGAQSDWDLFVIVQSGRLYTARLGLLVAAWLMGRLRTKKMTIAPDRFCFNHLITTDGLALRHRSLFTAHALSWLVPIYDPWAYAPRLRQANAWVTDYVSDTGGQLFVRRTVPRSRILNAVRSGGELILNTFIGGLFERCIRRWMQSRIESEPATHAPGGRIIADDRELEFHPRSFETVALARYNASLTRHHLGHFSEHDSGLAR